MVSTVHPVCCWNLKGLDASGVPVYQVTLPPSGASSGERESGSIAKKWLTCSRPTLSHLPSHFPLPPSVPAATLLNGSAPQMPHLLFFRRRTLDAERALQQSNACPSNFPTPPTNLLLQPDDHTPQSREIWHVRWEKYCVKKREKYTFPTPPAAAWPHTSKHLQTHTVSLIFSKSNLALSSCCLSGWVLCCTRAMQAGVKCHSTRLPKTCPHIFQHLNDQSRP